MNVKHTIQKLIFIIIYITLGCKGDEGGIVIALDDIIELHVEDYNVLVQEKKLKADGLTKVKLVAQIDKRTDEAFRTVTFKTSAGEFDVVGENKTEKIVFATLNNLDDDKLSAVAFLTLGTISGKYTVTASITSRPEYTVEQVINVLPLSTNDDLIHFQIENYDDLNGKAKADGLTKIRLVAKIPKETSEANRIVEFRSSNGKFEVSEGSENIKEVYATLQDEADSMFSASAFLTLDTKPGDYIISANIKENPSYKVEYILKVLPLANSDVIDLKIEPDTNIRADGLSLLKIKSKISNSPSLEVTFSINAGTILNSENLTTQSVQLSPDGSAETFVQVGNEVKDYVITAKIPDTNIELSQTIHVERAYPDKIAVEPSSSIVQLDTDFVILTIFLLRERGVVSKGTGILDVKAYQVSQDSERIYVGRFTGKHNKIDEDGKLEVHFFTDGDLNIEVPIIIEVSSKKDDGSLVIANQILTVKN